MKGGKYLGEYTWLNLVDSTEHRAWQGFIFEQVCLDHVGQTKKQLGISGISSNIITWQGLIGDKSAQIDLLIDRKDQVINLCNCKFSLNSFSIDKDYLEKLRSKISVFKEAAKVKKAVYLTLIST